MFGSSLTSIRVRGLLVLYSLLGAGAFAVTAEHWSYQDPAALTPGITDDTVLLVVRQTVSRTVVADNARRWRAAFDLEATSNSVNVQVRISLIPSRNVTSREILPRLPAWRAAIESAWSDQFALRVGHDCLLPIRFSVSFAGDDPHYRVIVRDFAPAHDQLHWSLGASPQTIAHEFGHMIGAFDEYPGGGTSLDTRTVDPISIMAGKPTSMTTSPRQLWLIHETLARALPQADLQIVRHAGSSHEALSCSLAPSR
jgi:hypothetical protein